MRKRRALLSVIVLMPALLALATPVTWASGAPAPRQRQLSAGGGGELFAAPVSSRNRCFWSATPPIPGFSKSQPCGPGVVSRSTRFGANYSTSQASWIVRLTVSGFHRTIREWRVTEAAPQITYQANVGANFSQDPANPFNATYSYSAEATAATGEANVDLAAIDALPEGILQLFSDGNLECAMSVGGAVSSGDCTVHYSHLGQHSVVAQYRPVALTSAVPTDATSALIGPYTTKTSQEIEQIGPYHESDNGTDVVYWATYEVMALTADEKGSGVDPSDGAWSFQLSGTADDGNQFQTTLTAPPGQYSCTITVSATLADNWSSQSSSVTSPDCSGGIDTGSPNPPESPGNNVTGWFVASIFEPTSPGFFASSSGTEEIICGE